MLLRTATFLGIITAHCLKYSHNKYWSFGSLVQVLVASSEGSFKPLQYVL